MTVGRAYPMSNQHADSAAHHAALAEVLDAGTTALLSALGDWGGARCLEVGAGGGSIAWWLAQRVGRDGVVVATDLDTSHLPTHPQLRPLVHDLRGESPISGGPFDLIHARLVLAHLPERERVLHRLIGLLAAEGLVVIEDWAALRTRDEVIIAAPDEDAAQLYAAYQQAVGEDVFDAAGTDRGWGRRIHSVMMDAGLTEVNTQVHTTFWAGGSAGCRLIAAVARQLRPRLAHRFTDEQFDRLLALLTNPELILHGHPLYITVGRKPG